MADIEHLQKYLGRKLGGHGLSIDYFNATSVTISLSSSESQTFGIEEFEALERIFGSRDIEVPAWRDISAGCDTCGHGSISTLDGLTINGAHPLEVAIEKAAVMFWEDDIAQKERQRQAELEEQRRVRERARRHRANMREQETLRKRKLHIDQLYEEGLGDVFDQLWGIYEPLKGIGGREYHEIVQSLPQEVSRLLFPLKKSRDQSKEGVRKAFLAYCEKSPKKMKKRLFPDGEQIKLNFRYVRLQNDAKMRVRTRTLEAEGFRVFNEVVGIQTQVGHGG